MTPFIATNAVLTDTPQPIATQQATAQLARIAQSNSAPWLYSALYQLRDVESNGRMIPGIGDLRVEESTASKARLFFSLVTIEDLPVPSVTVVSGGGVSVVWSMGDREVKLACYPDGQAMVFRCENDEIVEPRDVDFTNLSSAGEPLQWLVRQNR